MEQIHLFNIFIHVLAGTVALVAGFAALIVAKGGRLHVRFGKFFVKMITVVIVTGLVGVIVFQRNTFLLVITFLSGYTAYSGLRALKLRGSKPAFRDHLISVIVLGSGLFYLYYIKSIGLFWAPTVMYSTLGALAVVTTGITSLRSPNVNI